jgi:hypothetical protein
MSLLFVGCISPKVQYLRVPVEDHHLEQLIPYFREATQWMEQALNPIIETKRLGTCWVHKYSYFLRVCRLLLPLGAAIGTECLRALCGRGQPQRNCGDSVYGSLFGTYCGR